MHVAFHTRGHRFDHCVFEPSFPSFLLPYHHEPTLLGLFDFRAIRCVSIIFFRLYVSS